MRKLWILPIVFLLSFSILQVAKAQVGTGTREEFRQSLEEIRRQREQYRLEIRNQISNIRERALQQIQQKREELRERLRFLQDEQKRLIVEKIYNQINRLNTILTDKFLVTLDRLELVLRRIEDRTAMWDERGFDVSEVKNAISEASAKISSARDAVKTQASKTYEFNFANETEMKGKIREARQQFHQDIENVRALISDAKVAVRNAAVALAQIEKLTTRTPIPQVSP